MKATVNEAQAKVRKRTMTPSALRIQRESARVVDLYLQGNTMEKVRGLISAENHGRLISVSTIHKYIHAAVGQWQQQKNEIVAQHKAIELAKINALEATYWEAWYNSLKGIKTSTKRKAATEVEGKKRPSLKLTEVVDNDKESQGDAKFLQGVQWCIDKRCELLGIETPKLMTPAASTDPVPVANNITVVRKVVINITDQ